MQKNYHRGGQWVRPGEGEWARPVRMNDWGYETFAGLGHLQKGQVIRVRFPDGSESDETVVFRKETQSVSDHGKVYEVESSLPGVGVLHRGTWHYVPLDALEICWPKEA